MLHQPIQRKQKSFALQRGLYVVRYESAIDPAVPPLVSISCDPGRNEVVFHPDHPQPTLTSPGQALVLRALEPSQVQVEISSPGSAASLDVTLKFEPLRCEASPRSGAALTAAHVPVAAAQAAHHGSYPAAVASPSPIQLVAHVARRGDVVVGADEWAAGPQAPARVEGFLIRWPGRPPDVQLRYAAVAVGQRPSDAQPVQVDEYTGTRGRGRALLGFTMEVVGPSARNYALNVDALFLGSPARRASGQAVQLAGPSGREPLVGLRVSVIHAHANAPMEMARPLPALQQGAAIGPAGMSQPVAAPSIPMGDSRRVRVFRG